MKDSTIGRRALLIALAAGFAVTGNLFAYETKYTDKKTDEKTENNTEFKVDGVIFAGYERTDKENSGVPDANGTKARNQGFDIKRAYLNLIGNVTDGDYKGYGFRVTFDGGQVLGGTAATTSASGNNIHVPELKFAYMTMPLFSAGDFGSSSLRLGMQHTPTTDNQTGASMEGYWKHRYLDTLPTENVNMSSSADTGIGYIHKADYFGLHLLLANGEGFRKLNAQNIQAPTTFSSIATNAAAVRTNLRSMSTTGATADSYGLDLYGALSVKPTGKSKDFEVAINFPFRLQNVTGIRDEEAKTTAVDISTLSSPKLQAYVGDKRVKQDQSVGSELDVSADVGGLKITLGTGGIRYKDKRASTLSYDSTGLTGLLTNIDYTRYYNIDKDAYGSSNYGYLHVRYKWVGAMFRDIYGTGSSGSLSALPSKSYLQQLAEADIADGQIGNGNVTMFSTHGTSPTIDLGKARFRKQLMAIEFFPTPRWSIAVGMSRQTSTDPDGYKTKVSGLAQIPTIGTAAGNTSVPPGSSTNAESQVNTLIVSQNNNQATLQATDIAGEVKENKQFFVRAAYEF